MMRRDIGLFRWFEGLRPLDAHSRIHLKAFSRQFIFILVCSLPALLLDKHRPVLCLSMMRTMFSFSSLFVFVVAALTRQPLPAKTICIWDHFAAMLLLALVSSVVLQSLQSA